MNRKKAISPCIALAVGIGTATLLGTGTAYAAEPGFTLPFDCEQTWTGSNGTGPLARAAAQDPVAITFTKTGDQDGGVGENVWAAAGGKVTAVETPNGHRGGGGNSIVIDHGDGWSTRYDGVGEIAVKKGDEVTADHQLGKVGSEDGLAYVVSKDDQPQKAKFDGKEFQYPKQDVTSTRPCG